MTSKALLYLLITLLIGIGLGMVADRAILEIAKKPRMDRPPPERDLFKNLAGDLQLSPEQVNSIRPVVEKFFRRADSTRALVMKQAGADMDSLRQSLIPFLTEEQVSRMKELGLFRPGPPGPGGPPPPPGTGPGAGESFPPPPHGTGNRTGDKPPPPPR